MAFGMIYATALTILSGLWYPRPGVFVSFVARISLGKKIDDDLADGAAFIATLLNGCFGFVFGFCVESFSNDVAVLAKMGLVSVVCAIVIQSSVFSTRFEIAFTRAAFLTVAIYTIEVVTTVLFVGGFFLVVTLTL